MPARAAHIAQAEHNEALYDHLAYASPAYADWQVTALFYAALHYVDAYLASTANPQHPANHAVREGFVRNEPNLRQVYVHYRELKERSIEARYSAALSPPPAFVRLRPASFEPLRQHLKGLLGLP